VNPVTARRVAVRALVGLVLLAVTYAVFAHTVAGQRFDDAAKLYAVTHQLHFRRLETFASLVVVASIASVLGALALWARDDGPAGLMWAAAAVVPPWLLAELGKVVLPRPHLHPTPPWIGSPSFPSGHVTITASCVLAIVVIAPPHLRRYAGAFATLTMLVSMTLVIVSGMHRPSDVYGAPILAVTWASCLTASRARPREARVDRATTFGFVLAALLGVVGFALGSIAFHSAAGGRQNLPAQTVIDHALWGSLLVAWAIGIAAGVAANALLGRVTPLYADPIPSSGTARTSAA
jgi:membrane-associated phospholipid phosphatase